MNVRAQPRLSPSRAQRASSPGVLTISLDFELFWGMRDLLPADLLAARMARAREVVPALLDLFSDYGVHATWATVGVLLCDDGDDVRRVAPRLPDYADATLSPARDIAAIDGGEGREQALLAPSLAARIARTPGQELATHTFSHMYCLEPGVTADDLRADLAAARVVGERFGDPPRSIVFPRNQYGPEHVAVCAEAGIRAVRGNPTDAIYRPRSGDAQHAWVRAGRLVDAYVRLSDGTAPLPVAGDGPVNVPATRFLRPYVPALAGLEVLRYRRIAAEIRAAARRGRLVHLWWHPHNFTDHRRQNLRMLRALLDVYAKARARHGMESLNMGEVAARAEARRAG